MSEPSSDPSKAYAICVPAIPSEMDRILLSHLWWDRKFHPFQNSQQKYPEVDLVYFFPGEPDPEKDWLITESFEKCKLSRFFRRLSIEYAILPDEKDHYFRSNSAQPPNRFGLKSGPNYLFFHLIRESSKRYSAVMLMETDCIAVRDGWAEAIIRITETRKDAWQIGSHYGGPLIITPWTDHLNGNSIYRVGDKEYMEFFEKFLVHRIEEVVALQRPELAFDCAWEEYKYHANKSLARESVRENVQRLAHRFIDVDLIENLAPSHGYPEKIKSIAELKVMYPSAYIIHADWLLEEVYQTLGVEKGVPQKRKKHNRESGADWMWVKGFRLSDGSWLEDGKFALSEKPDNIGWRLSSTVLPTLQLNINDGSDVIVEVYTSFLINILTWINKIRQNLSSIPLLGWIPKVLGFLVRRIRSPRTGILRFLFLTRSSVPMFRRPTYSQILHRSEKTQGTFVLDMDGMPSKWGFDRILVIRNGHSAPSYGSLEFLPPKSVGSGTAPKNPG